MIINKNDKAYFALVDYILKNETFSKIDNFPHHGTTRLRHSMRVSYLSYKIAKFLCLDYKKAAISGLLHDFYLNEDGKGFIEFFKSQSIHPKVAALNALKHFAISEKEKDIIETHMWPFTRPSKYLEGWIVSLTDKTIGTCEYGVKFSKLLRYRLSRNN